MGEKMNNIDIREYIINNFKDEDTEKVRDSIETTINERNEDALIGLGVLFELIWNNSSESEKEKFLNIIMGEIKKI